LDKPPHGAARALPELGDFSLRQALENVELKNLPQFGGKRSVRTLELRSEFNVAGVAPTDVPATV